MHTIKSFFLGVILCIIPVLAFTQNSTNSPYTRYGYGILADKAFISQRGMGGIGYGLRNSQLINPMNPATYSAVDSMTFMFDFGISGQVSWMKDGFIKEREHKINGNLEYIAMQFPIAKKLGFGAGLEPLSHVGYNYGDTTHLQVDGELAEHIYRGTGGMSKVYGILSYEFLDRISVGVKLSYLFGDITHSIESKDNVTSSYSITKASTIRSYGFLYDFGLQYHYPIGKYKTMTIGAIYSPKIKYGTSVMTDEMTINGSVIVDLASTVSRDSVFQMPESFGFGFTYNQLGKLTVGADVLYQRWANVKYFDEENVFNNRLKFNIGGELIPNRTGNGLLNKIRYRAGLFYSNSYLKVKDSKYHEFGANLGLGIPMPDRRTNQHSFLNIALEYSQVKPELNTLIHEQYFKISLSYTFNELWFFKRKVQ